MKNVLLSKSNKYIHLFCNPFLITYAITALTWLFSLLHYQSRLSCERIPVSPAAVHQAVSKYNEGAYAGLELSPLSRPPTPHPSPPCLGLGPPRWGTKLTPRAASQMEQPLTCTFLFRLTAGKKRPSTFSNAMGPCCSSLIKNVKVFLLKSRRTPIVAPFVIPPSVLWKKKT